MRKMTKSIIAVFLILIVACAAAVHFSAVTLYASDGYYYSIDSSTAASVYGRYTEDENVTIEREFSGRYITSIAGSAFEADSALVLLDLTRADMLEKIGNYAFNNCSNLSGNVVFSGRINQLGLSCFEGCSSLGSIKFYTNNLTFIPEQCFYQCGSLNEVILPENLQRIDRYAFANTALTEITIPKSVTYIDPTAFDGDEGMTIYCYTDSAAHTFAVDNGYDYVLLDYVAPTEPPTEAPTDAPTEAATEAPTEAPTEPVTETPEPTAAPTELPTESMKLLLGDANGDGGVDIIDATIIQRVLANIKVEKYDALAADVDGNGEVDNIDVTFIMRYCSQIPTAYSIGEWIDR